MNAPQNIHVRLPNWVGDLVMATPALRALRHGFPEAKITVEGRSYMRYLMDPLETVDEFLDYPYPGSCPIPRAPPWGPSWLAYRGV